MVPHVDGLVLALGIVRPSLRSVRDWSTIDRLVRPDDYAGVDLHDGTLRLAVGEAGAPAIFDTHAANFGDHASGSDAPGDRHGALDASRDHRSRPDVCPRPPDRGRGRLPGDHSARGLPVTPAQLTTQTTGTDVVLVDGVAWMTEQHNAILRSLAVSKSF
jgi:hypothetical protein